MATASDDPFVQPPPPHPGAQNPGNGHIPPELRGIGVVLQRLTQMLVQGGGGFNVLCRVLVIDENGNPREDQMTGIQSIVNLTQACNDMTATMEEFMDRLEEAGDQFGEPEESRPRKPRRKSKAT